MTEAAVPRPSLDERVHADVLALFLAHWRGSIVAVTLLTVAAVIAGRDYVPLRTGIVWGALACLNYVGQAFVCWKLEHATLTPEAMRRWVPWLLVSTAYSSTVWGIVPWLLSSTTASVQLFACMFNLVLFFGVASAPASRAMHLCAMVPITLLTPSALALRDGLPQAALGAAAAFGLIMLYSLRVQTAIKETQRERHVAKDLTDELRRNQQRLVELENERTLLLERQRLMRDMHDGMGSTLLTSLVAVEQGQLDAKALAQVLRDCVEDLRLVIDSLEPLDHDLVVLLATLRYRLGQRMEAAGIRLEWVMTDLPPLPWLQAPQALQILRIVQEVLSNVIKHARATRVRIAATAEPGENAGVLVSIEDDGVGFEPNSTPAGRGLKSLQYRTTQLGGSVQIESSRSGGTRISLRLPSR